MRHVARTFLLAATLLVTLSGQSKASTRPAPVPGNDPILAKGLHSTSSGNKTKILATYEDIGCYGKCPAYKITIFANGSVEWNGKKYVKIVGKAKGRLTTAEIAELRAAFAAADFMKLNNDPGCKLLVTDRGGTDISYFESEQSNEVRHDRGCLPAPKSLTTLEKKIIEITKCKQWIGPKIEGQERRHGHR